MKKSYTQVIETQMQELHIRLSERNSRLYAGVKVLKLPYGGGVSHNAPTEREA